MLCSIRASLRLTSAPSQIIGSCPAPSQALHYRSICPFVCRCSVRLFVHHHSIRGLLHFLQKHRARLRTVSIHSHPFISSTGTIDAKPLFCRFWNRSDSSLKWLTRPTRSLHAQALSKTFKHRPVLRYG
ncbi:uncharacterized protein E5676_scaffold546G001930 [Cucumis melo var. makuwa]|uniref:Uncharacterized protein n=1 Tax=Cucumis melo var. makuwa TaxID=1194695 RepID=A0A5D3BEA6_CUCMM|nr:uncharacterized protein E6C27_scaffold37G00980 [Cucumis melo var. makuwa]TYJ96538.1 uncharacterized protein E5676_scaffold546G001930 [Cucumis melo var. makuwa]